ncbi:sigma-70 family RNA polymerase sigma factor [Chitinophaga sedimenti]|uniref:RNA polymerase sigma factor n=1 Tax=Chitinophaga sedimenti TaxID=2033606 RepID=UPI00200679AD|nr:sigma-70 family RNA polymerase sigma factor [Chitinophaga sedimenti]MCK7553715.1 sigma-70 family RNA polymerase sigma factor [Chitinophaga sedimenti]
MLHNESELLSGVANGDESAFRELMRTYQPLLLTYVYQLTKSESVSEEIVQDVFLKVWMGRESLAGVRDFKSYLFIICRNYALDQLRKLLRERERASAWENEQDTSAAVTASSDNNDFFFTLLDEAVAQLAPQQQKVYLMARRQGLSHAEIARQTGLSVLTVKKYMKLALAAITTYIKSRLPDVSLVLIAMAMGLENYF